jgi:hypothetical protein
LKPVSNPDPYLAEFAKDGLKLAVVNAVRKTRNVEIVSRVISAIGRT